VHSFEGNHAIHVCSDDVVLHGEQREREIDRRVKIGRELCWSTSRNGKPGKQKQSVRKLFTY
jgi:hypothetical protein